VRSPDLLEGVDVGDRVRFDLTYADGEYTVTDIEER
jgi:hypothetical protein